MTRGALLLLLCGLASGCYNTWTPTADAIQRRVPGRRYDALLELQVDLSRMGPRNESRDQFEDQAYEGIAERFRTTDGDAEGTRRLRADFRIGEKQAPSDFMGAAFLSIFTGITIMDIPIPVELALYRDDEDVPVYTGRIPIEAGIRSFLPGLIIVGVFGMLPPMGDMVEEAPGVLSDACLALLGEAFAAHPELESWGAADTAPPTAPAPPGPAPPQGQAPVVAVATPRDGARTGERSIELVASLAHPDGVASFQVLLNGAPLPEGTRGLGGVAPSPASRSQELRVEVPLRIGQNTISVICRGRDGQRTVVTRTVEREAPVQGARGKWAVVIGVSRYQHAGASFGNLRFAAADARAMAETLTGVGGFDPGRVRLLTDASATSAAVRDALFQFLAQALEEDLVVIYFAGHGAPEPGKPKNLFLLTHDADPARLAATAFPMWDVETALQRSIRAQRVLVLADACHAAGVAGGVGTRGAGDNLINRYLARLQDAGPGHAIFTASETGELSQEGERWGGGHGAFTWHLTEGLRGKADLDQDGIVTLGELIDHTEDAVRKDTASKQHPTRAGRFDRALPLSVPGR